MTESREPPATIGVVVHPQRDIEEPLGALRAWCEAHGSELGQVTVPGQERRVADEVACAGCELIVAIGGDGTTLAAIKAAGADRLVLGITCGSLGALTIVPGDAVTRALDRIAAGDWDVRELPALALRREGEDDGGGGEANLAINDVVVIRDGQGQVRLTVHVDGVLYGRLAGDGLVAATAVGSAAYTLAAGGPLLAPGAAGFVLTPLPTHGGFLPPLVLGPESEVELEVSAGHGGVRFELDGQPVPGSPGRVSLALRPRQARLVSFSDLESLLTGLRRRRILADSPRLIAEDERQA